jgi:hypothetical protein
MKPAPSVKLPAFALVAELGAPEGEFSQRLKVAFQTFIGLTNVDAAQKQAPPLELGSEVVDGVTLATSRYMVPSSAPYTGESPYQRYNFSPSAAQVGKYFILSSSAGLARTLIKRLKAPADAQKLGAECDETVVLAADGAEFARLLEINRGRLVMQTMLGRGYTKEKAERYTEQVLAVLRYLGRGRLAIRDDATMSQLRLKLDLAR